MIGKVAERREQRVAEIVDAAWRLAREDGIGGISLHALAREVGIRQPSLYAYFDSKLALYDAMFADGNRRLLERLDALDLPAEPRGALKAHLRAFVDFSVEDIDRCQLLFQRPIPGFEPSPASYETARAALGRATDLLRAAGVDSDDDVDCIIAIVAGLVDAQNANDPGGDRWIRHLDRLIDLYLDDIDKRTDR
jgi:AcrR family transcriptional regulator